QVPVKRTIIAAPTATAPFKTGVERAMEERLQKSGFSGELNAPLPSIEEKPVRIPETSTAQPEVGARADENRKAKTILPKSAGDYKLPSSALLHRPEAHERIDEEELKQLA